MIGFNAPWLLAALTVLPALWWLLRATPPAPRTETFPAIRLLAGLQAREETASRTPWWLLLLRLLAGALVIVGLAGPVRDQGQAPPVSGSLLLVIDDGWAAAPDWPARLRAADAMLDRASRGNASARAMLLTTAPDRDGAPPHLGAPMPVATLRPILAALRPKPWPVDRDAATQALTRALAAPHPAIGWTAVISDGLAEGDAARFAAALPGPVIEAGLTREQGSVEDRAAPRLLLPPGTAGAHLIARVLQVPRPTPSQAVVLARSGDGRTLGRAVISIPAGANVGQAVFDLPTELRNRLNRLVLDGPPSAGSVALLDESARRRPVGLLAGEEGADTPLTGPLFYVRRALAPGSEIREGDLKTLLARSLSVIIVPDRPLRGDEERQSERDHRESPSQTRPETSEADRNQRRSALAAWVDQGGTLIRFAGPHLAESDRSLPNSAPTAADQLLPVPLLAGDRQLGGALSWSQPAHLAAFPSGSPFAGLAVPDDVTIRRQVLAAPSAQLDKHCWARLTDGTPLVTWAAQGRGRVVLFHVTANADWSNLPLSGLFPAMLRRLVALSAGVETAGNDQSLPPAETLDGFGTLGDPPPGAVPVAAGQLAATPVSARHPPGFYGLDKGERALNLGRADSVLIPAAPIAGARQEGLQGLARATEYGPDLLALAWGLLVLDMLVTLRLRGLLPWRGRARGVAALVAVLALLPPVPPARPAWAQSMPPDAYASQDDLSGAGLPAPMPALATRLATVVSGDPQVDRTAMAGLAGLSQYVNRRTAAELAAPKAVVAGRDDLSFYPLLYWPITASATTSAVAIAALNDYMRHGGIILIDTRDGGSGRGFAPGTEAALHRVAAGLDIPTLAPLTDQHVIAHAFYLLHGFPGRFTGDPVWVQRDEDRANDSVSPVIIGGNDWAAAWAVDPDGHYPYAVLPGGDRQRTFAYRFGVNLVIYALTGNYKGDQVHVPALLERLGR